MLLKNAAAANIAQTFCIFLNSFWEKSVISVDIFDFHYIWCLFQASVNENSLCLYFSSEVTSLHFSSFLPPLLPFHTSYFLPFFPLVTLLFSSDVSLILHHDTFPPLFPLSCLLLCCICPFFHHPCISSSLSFSLLICHFVPLMSYIPSISLPLFSPIIHALAPSLLSSSQTLLSVCSVFLLTDLVFINSKQTH